MNRRWAILALLFSITVINFIDRQTLSVLAPRLKEIFGFSSTEYGRIVAAFQFGMMAGEFPMGALMDRMGVRFGFTFAVLWWSLATGLHSVGRGIWHFGLFRFWMGTGECGNFSGGMKVVSQWFARNDRAFAVGIFNSGAMVGSMIATPLIVWLQFRYGWQWAFVIPGAIGCVWVVLWRLVYRDPPVTQEDGVVLAPVRARELLRYRQTWAVMLARMIAGPVVQFYWYWTPDYLYSARGMSLAAIGAFAWIPFLMGDIGSVTGGWVAGRMLRRGYSVPATRRATLMFGALCCLASMTVVAVPSATAAIAVIGMVLFGHTFFSANYFAVITDLFPERAVGRVTGLTGLAGGFGGLVFPLVTGILIDTVSWTPVFVLAALMPMAGGLVLLYLARGWEQARLG
jgi:ACS family hexuronate transporter-like MFS transporter